MEFVKQLEELLENVAKENEALQNALTDTVRLTDYAPDGEIWTKAFQQALNEHETVIIPASEQPYMIDAPVVVPGDRRIIAEEGAVIRMTKEATTLMLRNADTVDGSYSPLRNVTKCRNISICGGSWEESHTARRGYGSTGRYDAERSFYGVSTCMFFENLDHLTLKNMTFRNCSAFGVQLGDISNVIIENIRFVTCYADGVHMDGGVENARIRNVSGQVGDDLVALNMYDWLDSSANFGPSKNILCEDLTLSPTSHYKALRILPGIFTFRDGSVVDCSLTNAIFRRIHNVKTFKLYCQTPFYKVGEPPEKVDVGSGDNILFEDIEVDLDEPVDKWPEYLDCDPVKGSMGAFELGSNIKNLYLKDIRVTLHKERYPYSYVLCIGPKSSRQGDVEILDPYFSSTVDKVTYENVSVNGEKVEDLWDYSREIVFDHLYPDMPSTAAGKIGEMVNGEK